MTQTHDLADPIATYDIMCEAANRLRAVYAEQVREGGLGDPAIIAIRALTEEVDAIPTSDLAAQRAKTEELARRYDDIVR